MEMQITDPARYCIKMDKHINKGHIPLLTLSFPAKNIKI